MAELSDTQHTLLSRQMVEAKRGRAKAEADRQVRGRAEESALWRDSTRPQTCAAIAPRFPTQAHINRISKLQHEEMRLLKRISEVHTKTKETLAIRAAKEKDLEDKQQLLITREEEQSKQRMEFMKRRQEQREHIRVHNKRMRASVLAFFSQ